MIIFSSFCGGISRKQGFSRGGLIFGEFDDWNSALVSAIHHNKIHTEGRSQVDGNKQFYERVNLEGKLSPLETSPVPDEM